MIACIISSILAFTVGFLTAMISLAACSQEKWERMKQAIEETREKTGANKED